MKKQQLTTRFMARLAYLNTTRIFSSQLFLADLLFFSYLLAKWAKSEGARSLFAVAYFGIGAGPNPFLFWGFVGVGQVRCRPAIAGVYLGFTHTIFVFPFKQVFLKVILEIFFGQDPFFLLLASSFEG